jgi:glucose-6-phosphate dehydrogenase assembly protein OpcA
MATAYKILGQSAPATTTATDVYTVPSSKYAVVSTITVANRATSAATYRISVRPNGDAQANQHYVAFDASVPGNDTIALTLGLTADAADVFTVYASTADLSFGVFGSEIDA